MVTKQTQTRRPTTKAEQRAETMEQILDEAEYLFSKHGFHGVTLKDVASRVGVHHTLLNYYFEDKEKLFNEVFSRRAAVTSAKRYREDGYLARSFRNLGLTLLYLLRVPPRVLARLYD